jgi:hypothetical protein
MKDLGVQLLPMSAVPVFTNADTHYRNAQDGGMHCMPDADTTTHAACPRHVTHIKTGTLSAQTVCVPRPQCCLCRDGVQ